MLPSSTYVQSNIFLGIYIIHLLRSILFFQLPSGINITSLDQMLNFFSSLFLEITSGRTILCWHWVLKIKSHPRWCMRIKSAIQRTCLHYWITNSWLSKDKIFLRWTRDSSLNKTSWLFIYDNFIFLKYWAWCFMAFLLM